MTLAGSRVKQLDIEDVLALQSGGVPPVAEDASRSTSVERVCAGCGKPLPPGTRVDAKVCPKSVDKWGRCRKRRWRFERAVVPRVGDRRDASRARGCVPPSSAGRFAYADPPYPGKAGYYPEGEEVDHEALIAGLERDYPDGWALSTSAAALRDVLLMCPASTRVCVWHRRVRGGRSRRALNAWEPLLVVGGRELSTDVPQGLRDVLVYQGRYDAFPGAMIGMKPPEFAVWMFRLLGARPGDELHDVFPGSGAIGRAWDIYASGRGGTRREAW